MNAIKPTRQSNNSRALHQQHANRWIAAALCGFGALASSVAMAAPVKVAILQGSSGSLDVASVAAQLNDNTYFDFNASVLMGDMIGSASALSDYGVVLLGGSGSSNTEYSASTLAAVSSFMQGGGGVVTAGWYRFGAIYTANQADADAITPVVTGAGYDFAFNTTVSFTNTLHAITLGVADFAVSGCCVEVASALDVGATSLATAGGQTAVAYQDTLGRSVYLGALYTANAGYGTSALRSGSADRLLEQSVAWAANGSSSLRSPSTSVPEPGSVALVLTAVAGLALARRRRA